MSVHMNGELSENLVLVRVQDGCVMLVCLSAVQYLHGLVV